MKKYCDAFPALVNTRSGCGSTPLYLAAEGNHVACVKYLVSVKAENKTDYKCCYADSAKGFTALYIAAEFGHKDSLIVLVTQFPDDINEISPNGMTPIFAAAQNGHHECAAILLKHGAMLTTASKCWA